MLGWVAASAALIVSVLGLLCLRIDLFDDSAMLLGARLVRAGKLPYVDFYTHYGPLGFSVLGRFLSLPVNPGLSVRIAQSSGLIAAALLFAAMERRVRRRATGAGLFVALAAVSAVFQLPAFLGFLFAFAAGGFFLLSRSGRTSRARILLAACAGASLAAAALVRPVFAAYAVAPVLMAAALDRNGRRVAALELAAALLAIAGLWVLLYARIPVATAADAALIAPARLVEAGGRFLRPSFFPAVTMPVGRTIATFLGGAVILATAAAWALGLRSRRARRGFLAVCIAGGLGSLLLVASPKPGRDGTLFSLASLFLVASLALICRTELRESAAASAAAFFGVAAAAFAHYFWQRPDRPHLMPLVALAAVGALLAPAAAPRARAVTVGVFVLAFLSVWEIPWSPFPAMHLANGGVRRILEHARQPGATWKTLWPAGELPLDATAAVGLADRYGGPGSRFVAVGSSQAWSSGNPVLLFLLSSRMPYTRWWAYDPGVQSSPAFQQQMWQEIQRSNSRTAVVWRAEGYLFERGIDLRRRTPFDDAFDRLYPIRGPRFGLYELRLRAGSSPETQTVDVLSSGRRPATERRHRRRRRCRRRNWWSSRS